MREKKILQTILERALRQIMHKAPVTATVHIALGELFELAPDVFRVHWAALTRGTALEHAPLHIRLIPAEVQCMACFSRYQPVNRQIHCPHCGSFGAKILAGEECILDSVELTHE